MKRNPIGRTGIVGNGVLPSPGENAIDVFIVVLKMPKKILMMAEDQLTEVAVQREVDLGDQKVDVQPSWMVKAKAARVKLMSGLNNGKDKVSAQFDYDVDGKEVGALEVGLTRQLKAGQTLAASYKPDKSDLEVSLQDDNFEDGATWTATANVPLESADANLLDAARVTLKR